MAESQDSLCGVHEVVLVQELWGNASFIYTFETLNSTHRLHLYFFYLLENVNDKTGNLPVFDILITDTSFVFLVQISLFINKVNPLE